MLIRNTTTVDDITSRKVMCKALANINFYTNGKPFDGVKALFIITRTVKIKKPSYDGRKYTSDGVSLEQARGMFNLMIDKNYVEFYQFYKAKPGFPSSYKNGTKLYKIGQLRMVECQETTWYKNRERKEKYLNKERELDTRRCKAIQKIYSIFGTSPFTYDMVKYTTEQIINLMHKDTKNKFTKIERLAIDHMRSKLYGNDSDSFLRTWQSLIANNYIIPYKIKTPEGYIKTTKAWKINYIYLKKCNAESI